MQTIVSEATASPTKGYLLLEANLEYNDETYDMYGQQIVGKNIYANYEDALNAKYERTVSHFSDFTIADIDEYHWPSSESAVAARQQFFAANNITQHWNAYELTIGQFIDYVTPIVGKDHVLSFIPSLVDIYEVEFDNG